MESKQSFPMNSYVQCLETKIIYKVTGTSVETLFGKTRQGYCLTEVNRDIDLKVQFKYNQNPEQFYTLNNTMNILYGK